jgi:uncharacterized protein
MNTNRFGTLQQALDKILFTLKKEYQPNKVILFGSMAQGTVKEWSDLDLVIIKETNKPFIQRNTDVALLCLAPVSVDYLVYTPQEFADMVAQKNHFIVNEVLGKGKVIYEQ